MGPRPSTKSSVKVTSKKRGSEISARGESNVEATLSSMDSDVVDNDIKDKKVKATEIASTTTQRKRGRPHKQTAPEQAVKEEKSVSSDDDKQHASKRLKQMVDTKTAKKVAFKNHQDSDEDAEDEHTDSSGVEIVESPTVTQGKKSQHQTITKRTKTETSPGNKEKTTPVVVKQEPVSDDEANPFITQDEKRNTVFLEDIAGDNTYPNLRAERPPAQCEVTDPDLFDPMLKETYKNLPNLRYGYLSTKNYGNTASDDLEAQYSFSLIPRVFPKADISLLLKAITFTKSGKFVNPSRADPSVVKQQVGDLRNIYAIQANATYNYNYTFFTSVVLVQHSNLHDPDTSAPFHQISVSFCKQEFERFCAFFCMVFKEKKLHAQMYKNCISISTRARNKEEAASQLATRSTSGLFAPISSSSSPKKSLVKFAGNSGKGVPGALNFDDEVPVYDGTTAKFNMQMLNNLHTLKSWAKDKGIIGCLCLVGYTANTWDKHDEKQLSLNIHWVVVLAAPEE